MCHRKIPPHFFQSRNPNYSNLSYLPCTKGNLSPLPSIYNFPRLLKRNFLPLLSLFVCNFAQIFELSRIFPFLFFPARLVKLVFRPSSIGNLCSSTGLIFNKKVVACQRELNGFFVLPSISQPKYCGRTIIGMKVEKSVNWCQSKKFCVWMWGIRQAQNDARSRH